MATKTMHLCLELRGLPGEVTEQEMRWFLVECLMDYKAKHSQIDYIRDRYTTGLAAEVTRKKRERTKAIILGMEDVSLRDIRVKEIEPNPS